jgi:hypothetical protein
LRNIQQVHGVILCPREKLGQAFTFLPSGRRVCDVWKTIPSPPLCFNRFFFYLCLKVPIIMGNYFQIAWEYLIKATAATGVQLLILFGPLLLLAVLMHFISSANEKMSIFVLGQNLYLYLFGWLGTSIHELGHALFAVIFGHKIKEIQLFKPDPKSGTLGYVKHSYNEKNLYHQTGNFFIGIGPVLMCTLMLILLSLLLFGINFFNFSDIRITAGTMKSVSLLKAEVLKFPDVIGSFLNVVFHGESSSWWKIALLIYCLYSIGSSITLSPADLKTSGKGLLIISILFFAFNLSTIWMGNFATIWLTKASYVFSGFYSIMVLSLVVNLVFVAFFGFLRLGIHLFKN